MSKKRMRYSAQFKFQLALGAAKGLKTIQEWASEHSVHPNQVSQWKRQLLEAGSAIFNRMGPATNASSKNGRWPSTSTSAGSRWSWSG